MKDGECVCVVGGGGGGSKSKATPRVPKKVNDQNTKG